MAPFIIAHRGDSGHRPENTLSSFTSALDLGVDLVEFDVQLTKDGHVVVIHDATVDRTTNGKGKIGQLTLFEIRRLSAGYPNKFGTAFMGDKVPTMAEALELLRGRTRVMVEIKRESITDDKDNGIEALTVAEVHKAHMEKDVILISFDRRALLRCREHSKEIARGYVVYRGGIHEMLSGAQEIGSDLVMPEKGMLSETLRDKAKNAGMKVSTWVVDDPDELRALAHLNLYGVGSNRPGVLLDALWESE